MQGVFSAVPEQADVLLLGGRISLKMLPVLKETYERMPEPNRLSPLVVAQVPPPIGRPVPRCKRLASMTPMRRCKISALRAGGRLCG